MKKVWLALALLVAGCDGGEACETEAETRCSEGDVETCSDGEWTVTVDCVTDGMTCMQQDGMADGEAHCM